jgi:hypothetical protein
MLYCGQGTACLRQRMSTSATMIESETRTVWHAYAGPKTLDHSGWSDRLSWNGIVHFEGGPDLDGATGHIDLYDGATKDAVYTSYPTATTVWFWKLG